MSKLPESPMTLSRHLRQQQRQMVRMVNSSAFARSGTTVTAEGVVTVDGELDVTGAMVVGGTLSLPAGIVGNDALTSPVVSGIVNFNTTGFSVTTAWSNAVAATITVPAGCTQLLATCTAEVYAINPNTTGGNNSAGGDLLDSRVSLNGSLSASYGLLVDGLSSATTSTSAGSFTLSGLTPGATLPISAQTKSIFQALGSNAAQKATITATLLWLR